jgi:L-ribulose-5-phosphate 3-epimerase
MNKMQLGVLRNWKDDTPEGLIKGVRQLEFPTCEIACWDADWLTEKNADALRRASEDYQVEITALWAGLPGEYIWDFIEGPDTIGLVPPHTRETRLEALKRSADFAHRAGISNVSTHVGFIPASPSDPVYVGLIEALKEIALHCSKNGQHFLFETGQETPVVLLRTMEDVGAENLGVCFDGANLLAYGTANPWDALDLLGPHVRAVHAKDGEYPVSGREFGPERNLGEGRVNLPAVIAKLAEAGYEGALTIEREVEENWEEDVKAGKSYLEGILNSLK